MGMIAMKSRTQTIVQRKSIGTKPMNTTAEVTKTDQQALDRILMMIKHLLKTPFPPEKYLLKVTKTLKQSVKYVQT